MNTDEIFNRRLATRRLTGEPFARPEEAVAWLRAVQSQDFGNAKWSLGQRARDATDRDVQAAFDEGRIPRTHVLRPTWHFVAPADIRWMVQFTAPKVHALNALYYRRLELDDALLLRCPQILARALRDGNHLTRDAVGAVFAGSGIVAEKVRLAYIMMHAETEGLVCSGAMRGAKQTYALIEERTPMAKPLPRDEALARLTRGFFESHGPATVRDYARWASLSLTEANAGLAMVAARLDAVTIGGATLWFDAATPSGAGETGGIFLLPEYDEAVLTYPDLNFPDRRVAEGANNRSALTPFDRPVIIDRERVGTWRRTIAKRAVTVDVRPLAPPREADIGAVAAAATRLGRFLERAAGVSYQEFGQSAP